MDKNYTYDDIGNMNLQEVVKAFILAQGIPTDSALTKDIIKNTTSVIKHTGTLGSHSSFIPKAEERHLVLRPTSYAHDNGAPDNGQAAFYPLISNLFRLEDTAQINHYFKNSKQEKGYDEFIKLLKSIRSHDYDTVAGLIGFEISPEEKAKGNPHVLGDFDKAIKESKKEDVKGLLKNSLEYIMRDAYNKGIGTNEFKQILEGAMKNVRRDFDNPEKEFTR